MGDDLLAEVARQILADIMRSSLMGTLAGKGEVKARGARVPKSALPPNCEDMDARLRNIRRYITPRELAALLHWHVETVYRKVKAGLPVDYEVDAKGNGRLLKIYPPRVADWLAECRAARMRVIQSKLASRKLPTD